MQTAGARIWNIGTSQGRKNNDMFLCNIFISKIQSLLCLIMLKNRRRSDPKSNKIDHKYVSQEKEQGCTTNITGWSSQEYNDYFSYSILNYLRASEARCESFCDQDSSKNKVRKTVYKDENKINTRSKSKYMTNKNLSSKQNHLEKEKLVLSLLQDNQSVGIQTPKFRAIENKKEPSRMSNFTQRIMTRKEYPRGIFEFKQTRKELEQLNHKNTSQCSERNSNVIIEDNKGMKVLPRIKPFLNANKLLKLQSLNHRKTSPAEKSSRAARHTNSQFIEQLQPMFDDQRIYCLSVHCLDD